MTTEKNLGILHKDHKVVDTFYRLIGIQKDCGMEQRIMNVRHRRSLLDPPLPIFNGPIDNQILMVLI